MSNNSEVDYDGDSYFFTYEDRQMVRDIEGDPKIGLTYLGSASFKGILGAPGQFIHVEGEAEIVRDKAAFAAHWDKSLDRWFPQGVDTPGAVMLKVGATRIAYWDGKDDGEIKLDQHRG
jgi:general stress protein 26